MAINCKCDFLFTSSIIAKTFYDYKVKYECKEGNIIGKDVTATVEITNKNFINKNVTLSDTSTLTAKTIKSENIKLKETNFTYTGKAVEPKFDVVIDGKVINPQYYTATYSNNLNAGTATLTVKGDGTHYSVTFLLMKFLFVISVTVAVTALPIIFPSVHSYITL